MSDEQSPQARPDKLVYVRIGQDTRIQCAWLETESPALLADIVLVEDGHGARRPARIVGYCERLEVEAIAGRVVAAYNVNPLATKTLLDVVGVSVTEGTHRERHRWGALGLPVGWDTRVSPVDVSLESDVAYARASRGYMEAQTEPFHRLVPGDLSVYKGNDVVVNAIDRRRDRVELIVLQDQSIIDLPLTTFLEERSEYDPLHGGTQPK